MRSEHGAISLIEVTVLLAFVVLIVWVWIDPLAKSAMQAQNSDREVLNEHQVLDLNLNFAP